MAFLSILGSAWVRLFWDPHVSRHPPFLFNDAFKKTGPPLLTSLFGPFAQICPLDLGHIQYVLHILSVQLKQTEEKWCGMIKAIEKHNIPC
jgi:hypothetical protein